MEKVLCKNEWVSLKSKGDGSVYSHEERCQGQIIAFLAFIRGNQNKVGVRFEYCPPWVPGETDRTPLPCSFTGGVDKGETPDEACFREAVEEAGIDNPQAEFHFLGEIRSIKSSDTVYSLYAVVCDEEDLKESTEGDGSQAEAEAKNVIMSFDEALEQLVDPLGLAILAKSLTKNELWGSGSQWVGDPEGSQE